MNKCVCTFAGQQPVLGYGNLTAELMLIGEAPGSEEVTAARPFIGRPGKLLTECLTMAGVDREECYITNTVKCRPANNRQPEPAEIAACAAFLKAEIRLINPKVIVCLGAIATKALVGLDHITKVHGKMVLLGQIKVVPVLHPAYILRNIASKELLVNDLAFAKSLLLDESITKRYTIVENMDQLLIVRDEMLAAEKISIDLETTGLRFNTDQIIGIGLSSKAFSGYYIPLLKFGVLKGMVTQYWLSETDKVLGYLKEIVESPIPKVGHNVKFDALFLKQAGMQLQNVVQDTMLTAYLLDERKQVSRSLDALSGLRPDLVGYKQKVDVSKASSYSVKDLGERCCEDCDLTLWLSDHFESEIARQGLSWMNSEFMPKASMFLTDLEYRGMLVDVAYGRKLESELQIRVEELQREINTQAGKPLLAQSDEQIKAYFATKGIFLENTKEHTLDTCDRPEELDDLVSAILEFRTTKKILSTYTTGLLGLVDKQNRIHSSYWLSGTDTGRLSSSEPNLQNIPARKESAKMVKQLFVATPGYVLVGFDYQQAEYRIAAWYAKDEKILQAINEGVDFHKYVASLIWGKPSEQVTKDERTKAKTINFAVLYGAGIATIARNAGITESEAIEVQRLYFRNAPKFKKMIDSFKAKARADGFVTSALGRRFRFYDMETDAGHSQRASVNYPIQHDASSYTLYQGGVCVHAELTKQGIDHFPVNIVHDAVYYEIVDDPVVIEQAISIIKEVACKPLLTLDVKMGVDISIGKSWAEL